MITTIATLFIGILIYLFIFWKRLKEDYASDIIFRTASNIILGVILGVLLSTKILSEYFFYLGMLGGFGGLLLSTYRYKIRFFETLEALVLGLSPFMFLFYLSDSVKNSSLTSFIGFLVILGLMMVFYYFDGHYKQYVWYRSGRVGFSGLATLALFFLIRSVVATFGITVLSFVRYEGIIAGTLAFISFMLIYNLGKK